MGKGRSSPGGYGKPVGGFSSSRAATLPEIRRRPRRGGRLDPPNAEPVGSNGWAQATQRRAAELLDISAELEVDGARGIDGGGGGDLRARWGRRERGRTGASEGD
jgi:hypothetical protein